MPVSLTCANCGETMTAPDEDALVEVVQAHVQVHADAQAQPGGHQPGGPGRPGHPGHPGHRVSREHILRRLQRQGGPQAPGGDAASPEPEPEPEPSPGSAPG